MRLLTRDENGALRLQSFHRDIPLYTILSHRWLPEEEEVTFQDIAAGTGTSKRGYFKLQFCADEAAKLGITHFWADTCCIDKSSSSELQEAIDSMYRWYRSALVCFVYMSDVVHNPSLRSLASGHGEFEHSSWFQRGWTLQELLAPALVFFYSQDKKFLGTKESLKQAIINATGIPAKALEGQPLSSFSVDERMSWAEGRSTTREEDRSYCLLGIFGIHMPLIYGEGECAARRRLLEEIQNASTRDESFLYPLLIELCQGVTHHIRAKLITKIGRRAHLPIKVIKRMTPLVKATLLSFLVKATLLSFLVKATLLSTCIVALDHMILWAAQQSFWIQNLIFLWYALMTWQCMIVLLGLSRIQSSVFTVANFYIWIFISDMIRDDVTRLKVLEGTIAVLSLRLELLESLNATNDTK